MIAIGLNLFLAVLLLAALAMGWRLNRRLKALRDSHDTFAKAVTELNWAAQRAEQGLADLRAATDEAADSLGDRIEKARQLTQRLDQLSEKAPVREIVRETFRDNIRDLDIDRPVGDRLGSLLAASRDARPARQPAARAPLGQRSRPRQDDDLFDEPLELGPLNAVRGGRR